MQTNEDGSLVFSHTSLDLWRLCKRRWYRRYVRGSKEPPTDNMAAGIWLCQNPIEDWHQDKGLLDSYWPNFLAEFGGDDSYDSPLFTKSLPQEVLAAYKETPVDGRIVEIEKRQRVLLASDCGYQSQPDMIVESERGRTAWDIKLKTFNQQRAGDTFFLKPALSPLDDQGMGQAVVHDCQAFGQIQFYLGKKDGLLYGPYYVEHPLNPVLADEWRSETIDAIQEIEHWLQRSARSPWPKNPQSCTAFGRRCEGWNECLFGFVAQ